MAAIFKSSVLIVLGVVPVPVVIATMAGFAIGHLRIRGGQLVFLLFLLGLTLPFEGVIVPIYYEIRGMGLLNTRWAIILPLIGLFMPFGVFWMRAHFVNMPGELSEAARVDGATTWQLFWRVHVPLARPAVASLGILLSVWTWNQFLLAIVLVDDPTKRTMAGALGAFQGQWGADIPLLSAGSLLILAPTIVVFFVFQRHFVAGAAARIAEGLDRLMALRLSDKWIWDFWLARDGGRPSRLLSCRRPARSDSRALRHHTPRSATRSPTTCARGTCSRTRSIRGPRQLGRPRHLDRQRDRLTTAAGTCSTRASIAPSAGSSSASGSRVSDDLVHWEKHPANPVSRPTRAGTSSST